MGFQRKMQPTRRQLPRTFTHTLREREREREGKREREREREGGELRWIGLLTGAC